MWIQFFLVSLLSMFVVIFVMTTLSVIQMRNKENRIIQSNISNSMYYMEQNIKNEISRCSHKVSSQQTARTFHSIKYGGGDYRSRMREEIAAICNEAPEIFAVFYCDSDGECYSAGEVFGSINSQMSLINECKSEPQFNKGDGLWRYARAGRKNSSLIWCKDIIYVDNNYRQINLGTIVLYLDVNKLSSGFFKDDIQTHTAVCDFTGTFAIAQDETLIGEKFEDVFEVVNEDTVKRNNVSYLFKKQNSSINGWEIISYIEMDMTGRNVAKTMTGTMIFAFCGLLAVCMISYVLSKRIGRPVEELIKYIGINRQGEITQMPEAEVGDIAKIRMAFEEMSLDLRKEIESNYEMRLRLNEITIKAYESQMNPHFLFNTLYMIQMMNVLGEKENITTITNSLGKLLRFNLDSTNEVKLSEEIENVKNYLDIMELRFQNRFNYKIIIPPELMECYTVKFMLQPLIENSVSHGFVHKKDMCEIVIMGQQMGNDMAIVIKDNGEGIEPERLQKLKKQLNGENDNNGGIGVVNVHERIKLLYGEQYGIDIFSDYKKNTNVLIHIPISRYPKAEVDKNV